MLEILAERNFPADEVVALASARSAGRDVSFGDDDVLKVQNLATFDFRGTDIGLFSPGSKVSAEHAPRAAKQGCVVIDNTSEFRMDPDVPLVVPEVNPEDLDWHTKRNIIANPNCSTIQMVVEQFGLAMIFFLEKPTIASAFTSGTIRGTSGSMRQAELLSMTTAPLAAIFGDQILDTSPPALINAISTLPKSKVSRSRHFSVLSPKLTSLPMDFREATA